MMTVNLGTWALATAVTSFAPSLAIPPASYSLPTMESGDVLAGRASGIRRLQASSMKWVPFSARTPRRGSRCWPGMPTGWPFKVGEAADQRLAVERLELGASPSRRRGGLR